MSCLISVCSSNHEPSHSTTSVNSRIARLLPVGFITIFITIGMFASLIQHFSFMRGAFHLVSWCMHSISEPPLKFRVQHHLFPVCQVELCKTWFWQILPLDNSLGTCNFEESVLRCHQEMMTTHAPQEKQKALTRPTATLPLALQASRSSWLSTISTAH